jgi:hypothetical protein
MDFHRANLTNATEAIRLLLSELALEDYRFTIDPREPESEVGVEYAATDGWRTATLHVGDAALLASRTDPKLRSQLASQWRETLIHARRRIDAQGDRRAEASALGRAWADEKANTLRDRVPAADWPDFWDEASNGQLPRDIAGEELREMWVSATRAAHDRWAELLNEQRSVESIEEDEHEFEAEAVQFEASLQGSLPPGIATGRDGSRVVLRNSASGEERSVTSEEDVAMVLEEWTEQHDS